MPAEPCHCLVRFTVPCCTTGGYKNLLSEVSKENYCVNRTASNLLDKANRNDFSLELTDSFLPF